jgi:hypothetical protein
MISAGFLMLSLSSLARLAKISLMTAQIPMWKVRSSAFWHRRHIGPWVAGHVWPGDYPPVEDVFDVKVVVLGGKKCIGVE